MRCHLIGVREGPLLICLQGLVSEIKHNKLIFINGQLVQTDFRSEEKSKIEFLDNQNDIEQRSVENSLINLRVKWCLFD